jgi:hypothetical protein
MAYRLSTQTGTNTLFTGKYTNFFTDEQIKASISNLTDDIYKQIDEMIVNKNLDSK